MSSRRRNEVVLLVKAWMEEALDDEGEGLAKRAARDSYSQERPLISASLSLPPHHALDLEELNPLDEDLNMSWLQSRPTTRPTGARGRR